MSLRRDGYAQIAHPLFPASRCAEAVELARQFFRLPEAAKESFAIERSSHFRGYSVMHNLRDWREQIHFGREEAPCTGPPWQQLRGPNLWPVDQSWRWQILQLFGDLERAGRDILASLAEELGLPPQHFLPDREIPYGLLKLIHYQPLETAAPRSGVAPHVDFSWITLVLQDDAGGLEMRSRDGRWLPVTPIPGTLVVNTGEVLEFATRGYFRAAPHRVVNGTRSRISLPFFLNPALDTKVEPAPLRGRRAPPDAEHVHRVFVEIPRAPFVFGDEEWKRKGLGIYCATCCAPGVI